VLGGIGAAVALAVGFVGTSVLMQGHHASSDARPKGVSLAGSPAPVPVSPSPSYSRAKPPPWHTRAEPSLSHGPRQYRQHSPPPPPPRKLPRVMSGSVFVGVAVKGAIVSGVRSFSRATGARIAMVEIYTRFGAPFPGLALRRVTSTGARPLIQWNPRGVPLARIAAGGYDTYLRGYAVSVRRFGRQVVLSFGHEMNGAWNPWGAGHVRPSVFVAAWRRIHNVFARAGVRNVTWSWDPSRAGELPRPWWPGRRYVDKIGIDGYQRPGQTFAQIFAGRLANIRSFTSKPIYIA